MSGSRATFHLWPVPAPRAHGRRRKVAAWSPADMGTWWTHAIALHRRHQRRGRRWRRRACVRSRL